MAPRSSTLAWRIPWAEEPGRLQSMGSLVGHNWVTSLSLFTSMHWRRKCQPTPLFLPGESQGRGSLVGCRSMRSHRVGHDWSDLAAAAAATFIILYFCIILSFSMIWQFWKSKDGYGLSYWKKFKNWQITIFESPVLWKNSIDENIRCHIKEIKI